MRQLKLDPRCDSQKAEQNKQNQKQNRNQTNNNKTTSQARNPTVSANGKGETGETSEATLRCRTPANSQNRSFVSKVDITGYVVNSQVFHPESPAATCSSHKSPIRTSPPASLTSGRLRRLTRYAPSLVCHLQACWSLAARKACKAASLSTPKPRMTA